MTATDASINLTFIDQDNKATSGVLKLQHNNGNVSLAFYPEIQTDQSSPKRGARFAQIPDHVYQLSEFTMIEMQPDNRLQVTLSGTKSRCILNFLTDKDTIKFFDYVGQKVRLKHSDCNPNIFLLESLDSSAPSVEPFMATVLPKPTQPIAKSPISISIASVQKPNFLFETSEPIKQISADEFHQLFDTDGKVLDPATFPQHFFNVDIADEVAGDLLKILLFDPDLTMTKSQRDELDEKNFQIYSQVKLQWSSVTKRQWDNFTDLQQLVQLLETDIKAHPELFTSFSDPKAVMQMAFNVFLTLSYYDWDGASYVPNMIVFLAPFLTALVRPGQDQEKMESDVFWVFYQFYTNRIDDLIRPSKQPTLKPLFIAIGGILDSSFPELLQLLYQKHAYSLDFLRDDCAHWFSTFFKTNDLRRLWISVLTFKSWYQFFQCFIVAVLYSITPRLVGLNPLNSKEFVMRFNDIKTDLDLNLLLKNTWLVQEITKK